MSRRADFDVWFHKYDPIACRGGNILFETYGEDLKIVNACKEEHVWTLLDCGGKLYISPGKHFVNRLNYFICEIPRTSEERDYKY